MFAAGQNSSAVQAPRRPRFSNPMDSVATRRLFWALRGRSAVVNPRDSFPPLPLRNAIGRLRNVGESKGLSRALTAARHSNSRYPEPP